MSETQPEIQWYIQIADGKKAGPVSWERLKKFAEQKKLLPETKVRSTMPDAVWVSAETIPNLFENTEETFPTQITSSEKTVVTKKSEEKIKPSENKEPSVASFSINTGAEQTKTNIVTKPIIKIDPKKSVPKEKTEEKKSTGFFGFGVQKSKTKTEEKNDVSVKRPEPEKKKTSGQSVSEIKISISPSKEKDKNKEKSSAPATFVISTEPTPEEPISEEELPQEEFPESEEFSESNESDETVTEETETTETNVTERNFKKHEKKNTVPSFPKRKTGIIPLLLITLAVLSILIGGAGGVGVFLLGYYNQLAVFSATLGTIIFLFGMILGIVSWFLALLFNQSEP
jgi:hypothetical protein